MEMRDAAIGIFGANLDDSTFGHGLERVEKQVVQYLGVHFGEMEIFCDVGRNGNWSTGASQVNGVGYEFTDGHHAANGSATLGERQQLGGEEGGARAR